MNAQQIKENDERYVAHTYARFNLVAERGKGATVFDTEGREYVDLGSGIGVNSLGYGDEGWIRAITKQAGKLAHLSNLYYTEPCGTLAKELCLRTGMQRVFFSNSGAEANEGAIKCARKYSLQKYGPGRHVIATLQNSFHGRTMATLSATGQEVFHRDFLPFLEGFRFLPPGDESALNGLGDDVCAVMLELVQGEGGVMPLAPGYVDAVRALCEKRDLLLLVDEVQTGVGRTGRFLCCEHYRLRPDIVTLAKGLGGGLPIGAVLFGEKTAQVLAPGDHASTFGGSPVVCAGALEVLSRLDGPMLDEVGKKGEFIRQALAGAKNVEGVDGLGLMLGIRLREGIAAKDVVARAMERGVLPLTAKAKVRLLPPLVISWEELRRAMDILKGCIEEF